MKIGLAALSALAAAIAGSAWAQTAVSYDIDLSYAPDTASIQASAVVGVDGSHDAIDLYLHDELRVTAVLIGGQPTPFFQQVAPYPFEYTLNANRVHVLTRGRDLSGGIRVIYIGRFSPSAARSPSDYMRVDAEGVFLRAYGYSLWFPVLEESGEDPPPVEVARARITSPARYHAVFVGEEVSRTIRHDTAISTWRAEDLNLFDAQLSLRPYRVTRSGPVLAYSLEDEASLAAAGRIVAVADQLLGYYRGHYRQSAASRPIHIVQLPQFGDIASANVIGVADESWRALTAQNDEVTTLAHEVVHAFVQGRTPRQDPLYAFSIEGFPSYFHWPALGALIGEAVYENRMDRAQIRYLERRQTGLDYRGERLPPEKPILQITADEIGLYKDRFVLNDRALLVWDYLRRNLGREGFDALVREMSNRDSLTSAEFFTLIQQHAPLLVEDAHLWLETTDFPDRLRRPVAP